MKGAGNWAGFVFLLWWRHTDVGLLRPFKHFLDLPLVCPQGRAVPSHLCATK